MGAFGVDTLLPTTCFTLRLEPNADAFGMLVLVMCKLLGTRHMEQHAGDIAHACWQACWACVRQRA